MCRKTRVPQAVDAGNLIAGPGEVLQLADENVNSRGRPDRRGRSEGRNVARTVLHCRCDLLYKSRRFPHEVRLHDRSLGRNKTPDSFCARLRPSVPGLFRSPRDDQRRDRNDEIRDQKSENRAVRSVLLFFNSAFVSRILSFSPLWVRRRKRLRPGFQLRP